MTDKISGRLVIIFGPMFAGKSEETYRRIRRFLVVGKKVIIVKPKIDKRYNANVFRTHAGSEIHNAIIVSKPRDILNHLTDIDVLVIEELQFFTREIIDVILYIINEIKIDVIANTLVADYNANLFGFALELFPHADEIMPLRAICTECGSEEAIYSQAVDMTIKKSDNQVHVGSMGNYVARCRNCYEFSPEIADRIKKIKLAHSRIKKKSNGKRKSIKIISPNPSLIKV